MGESTNGFNQREKAFEAQYLHDEELTFRINTKRNRLFGLWAADLLKYKDEKITLYVEEVMGVDLQKIHKDDVLHKVLRDLKAAKIPISEYRVRKELEKCWVLAHAMIMNEEG